MALQFVISHMKMKAGQCIRVEGTVAPEAESFALRLGQDSDHLILYFNPHFVSRGDMPTFVCDSMKCGDRSEEMRKSSLPFRQGEETEICISFDVEEVTVKLSKKQVLKFPNLLRLEAVAFFSVTGDLEVKLVAFE